IGRLCWQFPCATPSDWQAQHLQQPNNPATVADMQAALDATVVKQGVFNLVFHPHGWIRNDQVINLIDHAVARHGGKVKFLTFREAQERLDAHLLAGQPLRAADGQDNGVRLIDLDADGWLDVVIGNEQLRQTRLWSPERREWIDGDFPALLTGAGGGAAPDAGARFGIVRGGRVSLWVSNEQVRAAWTFDGRAWVPDKALLSGLELDGRPILMARQGRDLGVRLRDVDGDGRAECIVGFSDRQAVLGWDGANETWRPLPFGLPAGTAIVDGQGRDAGLRWVDVDEDGHDDLMFSDGSGYSLHLFTSINEGWPRQVLAGKRPEQNEIPPFVLAGTNQGAWFHSRHLWIQNENTDRL
ncbi:MAG: VCBS repeat-containing protein, partial [Pirellulales bacterium]